MRTSLLRMIGLALATAVLSHLGTVLAAPYVLMDGAMTRMLRHAGKAPNQWIHPPRVTEKSRRVVRPSPDLAYSVCVYDLANGPVRVTAAAWDDYMSVSVFAANSDNVFVINDRQAPAGVDLTIVREGEAPPAGAGLVVASPSDRGIVLQRRVAPTEARWLAAASARRKDVCSSVRAQQTERGGD